MLNSLHVKENKGPWGHAKLISCSTEHQKNEVGLVGRKEKKLNVMSFPVWSNYYFLLKQ